MMEVPHAVVGEERMMEVPFVGPRPFDTQEKELFFGRRRETEMLLNLLYGSPLTVVFAPSGTGKSSLLRAGLIPELQRIESFDVEYVDDWSAGFDATVRSRLEVSDQNHGTSTLGILLEARFQRRGAHLILILDQFEDLTKSEDLEGIWDALADVVATRTAPATVVLCLREDYLADLDGLAQQVSGIFEGGFRLPPLGPKEFEEAVHGPLQRLRPPGRVEPGLVERVMEDLSSRDQRSATGPVEPGHFQIVWKRLWEADGSRSDRTVTLATYRKLGGAQDIVKSYLTTRIDELSPNDKKLLYVMSRFLVLPTGAKIPVTADDLASLARSEPSYHTLDETTLRSRIDGVLEHLTGEGTQILRRVQRGQRLEYELVHDLIGQILNDWRDSFGRVLELSSALLQLRDDPVLGYGDEANEASRKRAAWRQIILSRARRARHELLSAWAATPPGPGQDRWGEEPAELILKAKQSALQRVSPRSWLEGCYQEQAWLALHEADAQIIELLPAEELLARADSVLDKARRTLGWEDPRVRRVESLLSERPPSEGKLRPRLAHLARATFDTLDDKYAQSRGYRNRLIRLTSLALVGIALAFIAGAMSQFALGPAGHNARGLKTVVLIMLFGSVGALITAIPTLAKANRVRDPFSLRFFQLLLKLAIGPLFAIVGVLILQNQLISGLLPAKDLGGLLVWATLFGGAQQSVTRFIDKRVTKLLTTKPSQASEQKIGRPLPAKARDRELDPGE